MQTPKSSPEGLISGVGVGGEVSSLLQVFYSLKLMLIYISV